MRAAAPALTAALLLGGCAAVSPASSPALLQRADDQMAAAQYRGALTLYDQFIERNPHDPAVPRARMSRTVAERLLLSQAEIERLRRELDTRQAEISGLKADLERLRRIDLRQAPPSR